MPPTITPDSDAPPAFLPHFEASMAKVRAALTELYAAVGADPAAPQTVSRTIGINRNLAWKLSRIVLATDPVETVQHVPGRSGVDILLRSFGEHGAPESARDRVREAAAEFDRMVATHAGSRSGLELMLGSMLPHRVDPLLLESSRKLAFQGQSAIWGVQAKTRFAAQIVAPNATIEDHVDLAVVSGHTEFRRLRPVTRWPLQYERTWGSADPAYESIDDSAPAGASPFLREFCTPEAPEVDLRIEGENRIHELPEGPVGNTASFTYAFGFLHRVFASIRADEPGDVAEHSVVCDTPSEWLVIDLLLHRDLPITAKPGFCTCHLMQERFPLSADESYHLPKLGEVQELGEGPPLVATPHVPRHHEMLSLACDRLGHPIEAFRGYRFTLSYPPIPTRSAFYYPLAE